MDSIPFWGSVPIYHASRSILVSSSVQGLSMTTPPTSVSLALASFSSSIPLTVHPSCTPSLYLGDTTVVLSGESTTSRLNNSIAGRSRSRPNVMISSAVAWFGCFVAWFIQSSSHRRQAMPATPSDVLLVECILKSLTPRAFCMIFRMSAKGGTIRSHLPNVT